MQDHEWNIQNAGDPDDPFEDNTYKHVGTKKPNPFGLYDMHGNVSEWVLDPYNETKYKQNKYVLQIPQKTFTGIVRGGSYLRNPHEARSAARLQAAKIFQIRDPNLPQSIWWYTDNFDVGFRIVRPLNPPSKEEQNKYWDAIENQNIQFVLKTQADRQAKGIVQPLKN